ncbi:hypothetical protein OROMI_008516 [Orobanche minor]
MSGTWGRLWETYNEIVVAFRESSMRPYMVEVPQVPSPLSSVWMSTTSGFQRSRHHHSMTSCEVQKMFGKGNDVKHDLYASGDLIRRRGNRSLSHKDSVLKRVRRERETRRGNDAQVVLDLKFERMLPDVVLLYNTVSSISRREQTVKLNQEGFEVFREYYPAKEEDSIVLECIWQRDKYVLVERKHKYEANSQETDVMADVPLR